MGVMTATLPLTALVVLLAGPLLRWCPHPEPGSSFAELVTAPFRLQAAVVSFLAGLIVFALTPTAHWLSWAGLVAFGTILGLVDLRTSYLPSRLIYLGSAVAAVGVAVAAISARSWTPLATAALGGVGALSFFWLLWRLSAGKLGFGDVRLAGFIGLSVGVEGLLMVWTALLHGAVVGAIWGLVASRRRGGDAPFPYGPALLLGPLLALVLNPPWLLG